MSINVNVTGNPISINRGKLVAIDPDYAKKEFEKRRRIRLLQVRQQSKDIAEDIRNRVRKAKTKQLSNIEKKGEKELKKWQARKLLGLQQQYQECLEDIGLGHIQAAEQEELESVEELQKEEQNQAAKERGKHAARMLQAQYEKEKSDKAASKRKKKFDLVVEGTRSAMVANLNKAKTSKGRVKDKPKRLSTDINISTTILSGSDSETEVPLLVNLEDNRDESPSSSQSSPRRSNIQKSAYPLPKDTDMSHELEKAEAQTKAPGTQEMAATKWASLADKALAGVNYSVDTRISDRIKRRTILNNDYNHYDNICDKHMPSAHQTIKSSTKNFTQELTSKADIAPVIIKEDGSKRNSKSELQEIPSYPTVVIRTVPNTTEQSSRNNSDNKLNKVQYYDHQNRYVKEYIPENVRVQKIPQDAIQVCPTAGSEEDFLERAYKRDQESEARGRRALEKEKVQKEYKEMMKRLPVLQKQERIASIPTSKPKFHMSDNRLEEHERNKQHHMENAYEKLFPSSRVVTIPYKTSKRYADNNDNMNMPYKTVDPVGDSAALNVASWDIDAKSQPNRVEPTEDDSGVLRETIEKVLSESSNIEKIAEQRKESLHRMLSSLTYYRDKLVKELALLPQNDDAQELITELSNVDKIIEESQNMEKAETASKSKRKRSPAKRKQHTQQYESDNLSGTSSYGKHKPADGPRGHAGSPDKPHKPSKYHTNCTRESSPVSSPKGSGRGKPKSKRPTLVLQNTSTQTTPTVEAAKKVEDGQHPSSSLSPKKQEHRKVADTKFKSCDCKEITGSNNSETCQIVIKITEDGKPQICLSPTKLENKEIVVKTQTKEVVASEPKSSKDVGPPTSAADNKNEEEVKRSSLDGKHKSKDGKQQRMEKAKENLAVSWRDFLSQNSTNSSTSYYSSPDFKGRPVVQVTCAPPRRHYTCPCSQLNPQRLLAGQSQPTKCRPLSNLLKDKPQQSNIHTENGVTPNLLPGHKMSRSSLHRCIMKLLTMSRKNVDDLPVSSVSEISTPGSSIINAHSNNPAEQLQNIMKHFNVTRSDLESIINYSSNGSNMQYNTTGSLTVSSGSSKIVSSTSSNNTDARRSTLSEYSAEKFPAVLAVYDKLAENSTKKIENLAAMIEKIRLDKRSMLHSPGSGSDKENSTRYMELPPEFRERVGEEETSCRSPEQVELDRQLLDIESFVDHLKSMTPAEIKEKFPVSSGSNNSSEADQEGDCVDRELLQRFKNLKDDRRAEAAINTFEEGNNPVTIGAHCYTVEPLTIKNNPTSCRSNDRSKPPTSKGLFVARRFNNISLIPHELSTIAESESLLSVKLQQSLSQKLDVPPEDKTSDKRLRVSPTGNQSDVKQPEKNVKFQGAAQSSSSDSLPDILTELINSFSTKPGNFPKCRPSSHKQAGSSELESDSSTSSIEENMENVLKTLGMGWAIATLKKTQEALALTSSSSSVDVSLKHKDSKPTDSNSSKSESIREILGKQFLKTLSTSNKKSDDSYGSVSFMRGLEDLSGNPDSRSFTDKNTQRTSTPLQDKMDSMTKDDSQSDIVVPSEYESFLLQGRIGGNRDDNQFYSLSDRSKSTNDGKED